jgi:26S proteasome regulatory subunit N4
MAQVLNGSFPLTICAEKNKIMLEIQKLDEEKKAIEKEAEELASFLNGEGMPGLKGGLIDEEGFPRQDLDIYAIRNARHRLAILKTNYKHVVSQIEEKLYNLHATSCVKGDESHTVSHLKNKVPLPILQPFGYVDQVTPLSVADLAGIKEKDQIIRLGSVQLSNENTNDSLHTSSSFTSVSSCFNALFNKMFYESGKPFAIHLLRDGQLVQLKCVLQPNECLGCYIKPL